jgi:hypothetical protein
MLCVFLLTLTTMNLPEWQDLRFGSMFVLPASCGTDIPRINKVMLSVWTWFYNNQNAVYCWVLVTHACNPSNLGSWEDCSLRPVQTNSLPDPISKITSAKWTGGVKGVKAGEHLLFKCEGLISNPSPANKKKNAVCASKLVHNNLL